MPNAPALPLSKPLSEPPASPAMAARRQPESGWTTPAPRHRRNEFPGASRTQVCSNLDTNISHSGFGSFKKRSKPSDLGAEKNRRVKTKRLPLRKSPPKLKLPGRLAVSEARIAFYAVRAQAKASLTISDSVRSRQPVHLLQHRPAIALFRPRVSCPGRQ